MNVEKPVTYNSVVDVTPVTETPYPVVSNFFPAPVPLKYNSTEPSVLNTALFAPEVSSITTSAAP